MYADETYADWLLWRLPALRGSVAYDARLEILSEVQLAAIADFKGRIGPGRETIASGFRLLVLYGGSPATPQLEHAAGARVLYDHDGMVVIRR